MGIQIRTTEQRVAVAREFVARVFNGHEPGRARDFFTADEQHTPPYDTPPRSARSRFFFATEIANRLSLV